MRWALGLALALMFGCAGNAGAATIVYEFTIQGHGSSPGNGAWFQTIGSSAPFGLTTDFSVNPVLTGTITVDDVADTITALDYTVGTKTWSLADITNSGPDNFITSKFDAFGDLIDFDISFDLRNNVAVENSSSTVQISDGTTAIACNSCVTFFDTAPPSASPEPATWALLFVGIAALGGALRARWVVAV